MTEVHGEGPSNARILFLGEAPASAEVAAGRPFQGRSGQQFDQLLRLVGIKRSEVYITNASLERVNTSLRKKDDHFFNRDGSPTPALMRGCIQLQADIQRIKPNVVVPLGNYALWVMMQHQGIMKWRGSILWSDAFQVKVIPTIHPAFLLWAAQDEGGAEGGGTMYKMLTAIHHDLRRAKEQSAFPELRLRPRQTIINPEGADLDEALELLHTSPRIVFDMETFGKTNLACAGFSAMDPERAYVFQCNDPIRILKVRQVLEDPRTEKVGHNICGYDVPMLDCLGWSVANVRWDTMVAQHILTPDLQKSLGFLTSIYTDVAYYKDEGKILGHIKTQADMDIAMKYCGKDNMTCAEIALEQPELLEERGLMPVMDRSMKVFVPLREAMKRGFRCDLLKLYQFAKKAEEDFERVTKEINELAGKEVNINSPKQVGVLLYDEQGIAERKKKGKRTTSAHVLKDIAARNPNPLPNKIIEAREYAKLTSNYYNIKVLSPDRRIRTVYSIPGTKSKRLASAIPLWGPGIPIQTIPAKAKEAYLADDGWSILECDQAQAEAVVVAYMANDPIHMDCFRTGKDVHRVTAALLNGMPIDDWIKIPKPSQVRELAKTCNHELNYNAKAYMFMLTVNKKYDPEDPLSIWMDIDLATATWNRYHYIRPALAGYWESVRKELRENQMTLRSPLGWEYTFLDKWSDQLLNLAYSWKPQSTVGESTNIGICQVFGLMDPPSTIDRDIGLSWQKDIQYAGVQFMAQVHDSGTYQVPTEAVEEIGPKIMRLMEVPLTVNHHNIVVPIEGAYGSSWSKKSMTSLGVTRKTVEL